MRDELNEQLSALVDDELAPEEVQLLTRRVGQSDEAVDQLGRYFLIRDTLHRDFDGGDPDALVNRVAAALEDEPAHNVPRTVPTPQRRWQAFLRPVAGGAIAATVAMLAVLLWPQSGGDSGLSRGQPTPIAATSPVPAAAGPTNAAASGAQLVSDSATHRQWERLEPGVQQRLNGYLINHSEHSSTGQLGGVLSYVRIAGHEEDEE